MGTRPIVLIHGLWMTPRSWEKFAERYTAAGHVVHAPSWPGLEGEVEAIRADPSPLGAVTIATIVDHDEQFIRGLAEAPIILGHSFGGLIAQKLAGTGVAAATVAIEAAPFRGVLNVPLSSIRAGAPRD